ncbi:DUF262 domain-containing protein [Methylosinus sporium]|uniref:DUF262 domain-containing protein n=1 Tax=Methylosinus sporium TaxID=428 RepID=A0A549SDA4_METSR|nr:DUF262 domain-containing protein [Methylosinus sporium]TRL25158.1 DUF262 domain-containing protein [Methylosinus sporium]
MEAHAVPLLAIFEKKMRLEVPLFQRQYVWGRESQWEPLWDDIARKFVESVEGRTDAPVHFLGAMVLDQKQTPVTHVEKRQVIDGQQRLTTFQIFLSALRDFCRAQGFDELAKECANFTENRGMMADPKIDCFKVWPTQLDRTQFSDVVLSGSRKEIEKRHPIVWRKWARKPDPRPKMVEAYLFFYDQLSDFFLGSATEPAIHAETPVSARLEECFQALKNSLQVVTIDLQPGDDPQVIFETLNARGEPLLPADLLRNYIFLRAARAGEDQEALYTEFWRRFDDPFWREEVKQGRLTRPRSDLFMQHFLASQIGEDIPVKHLFVEYKNWIDRKRPYASVTIELAALSKQGDNFRRILEPKKGDPIWDIATFLEAFDIRTAYPLLLMLLETGLGDREWETMSKIIESYLLRRAVCALNTKNYNRVFLSLTKNLRKDGVTTENLRRLLLGQSGESSEWPTDSQFKSAWLGKPAYDLGNAKLVHIFTRLNETYFSAKSEPIVFEKQPTIEHILPQQWIEHWPLPEGRKGLVDGDLLIAADDDPRARSTAERNRAVQNIGNLTILTLSMNAAQSNCAWNEKRPELMKHSLLPINQALNEADEWNEDKIAARAEDLFARALTLWPRG